MAERDRDELQRRIEERVQTQSEAMAGPLDMNRLHRRAREINANLKSPLHPHEPEIPPALDPDGRCWVCKAQFASERLAVYVNRIADARSRAADAPRDAYTLALGQLRAVELIDEPTWRAALDRPRVGA
jgi:hypothetical protein